MIKDIKKCKECGNYNKRSRGCDLYKVYKSEEGYCDLWEDADLPTCMICGKPIRGNSAISTIGDTNYITHIECSKAFSNCSTCKLANECKFYDTSYKPEIPIMIKKTIDQQGMRMMTEMPNPDRRILCQSCKCFKDDFCYKQLVQGCDNYIFIHGSDQKE